MKRSIFTLLLLTPLLFFIALTTHAQSQNFDTFGDKPTVAADGTIDAAKSGFVPCSGITCSPCDLVVLFNTVLKWFMTMAFLLFAVLAILAGFKLISSGGNSGALKEAKGSFTNAFIGLLIILSAWLIVDTLLRKLLPSGNGEISGYGPWASVQCANQVGATTVAGLIDGDPEFIAAEFVAEGGEEPGVIGGGNNCPAAPASSMVDVPAAFATRSGIKVSPTTLRNFTAMRDAASKDGITLKISSGWRSEEMQVYLFNKFCPSGTCGKTKAAKPCTFPGGTGSNHNSGAAIDIADGCRNGTSGCSTPTYKWLKENGKRFTFLNNLPTDQVHWSPTGR